MKTLTAILEIADKLKVDKKPSRTQFTEDGRAELVVNQAAINYLQSAIEMEAKLRAMKDMLPEVVRLIERLGARRITSIETELLNRLKEWGE